MKKAIFAGICVCSLLLSLAFSSCEEIGNELIIPTTTSAEVTEEVTTEVTEEVTTEVTEEVTTEVTEELTAEVTEEVTTEVTEEVTTEVTEEVTTEVTEEVTTEVTEEVTAEVTEEITAAITEEITEPLHEHLWSRWNVITAPSCLSDGKEERTCSCGENEIRNLAAVGHSEVIDVEKAATCTESGLTQGKHCSVCSAVIVAQKKVSALGHKEVTDAAKAATCTESGLTQGKHCSVCSAVIVAQKAVSALGHKEVTDAAKAATCTENGLTQGKHCSVCSAVIVAQDMIPALGHSEVTVKGTEPTDCEYGITDKIYCEVCSFVIQDHKKLFPLGFDVASNYSNDYGYNSLGTLKKATAMQSLYMEFDEMLSAFHNDVNRDADQSRVVGSVNYSALGLSYDEAISVYVVYKFDHPLYYWISNSWSYSNEEINVMVDEHYAKGADRAEYNDLIYTAVMNYIHIVENESSLYHITLGLHDAIVNSAKYAYKADGVTPEDAEWAHSIIGILDRGEGVCESYAKLFELLLNYCDINNIIVCGTAEGGAHDWNMVELDDGKWYWYDLTWDEIDWISGVTHTSFCVNDTQDPTEHIGGWTICGCPFINRHLAHTADTFGKDYCYEIPERSDTVFEIDDTMLYDTFTLDGTKYMVIGYDTVYCSRYWGISGNEPEIVTYNGRTYKVIVDA